VGLTHHLSVVMPGLVPGTHVFGATKQGAGGRDIRAFTPVFAGYARRGKLCVLDIAKSVLRLMDTIQKIREPLLVVGVVYIPDRCVTALFRKPYCLGTSIQFS